MQTESNAVSQNNDEVEASSVNKAGSEAKEADAEDVLQAEPKVEGSENVNHVEDANEDPSLNLQDSFENCVDSNEAGLFFICYWFIIIVIIFVRPMIVCFV